MRIRTIKPEWLDDERLVLASSDARVLSVALLLLADDYGRGRANKVILGARVFPGKILGTLEKALGELANLRFVLLYEVDGQSYFAIRNWEKHQKVDKPGRPQVPEPLEELPMITATLETAENIRETHENFLGTLATDQDQDQDQDQEETSSLVDVPPTPDPKPKLKFAPQVREVFACWLEEHVDPDQRSKCRLNPKRSRRIEARLREGYSAERLCAAIRGVKHSRWHMGDNPDGKRWTSLDVILRDGEQVEKFEGLEASPPSARAPAKGVAPARQHHEFTYDPDDFERQLASPSTRTEVASGL